MREKIADAKSSILAAASAAKAAKVALSLKVLDVAAANREIDILTKHLLNASTSLEIADARITGLERANNLLADTANAAVTDKNLALARADKLDAQRRSAVAQRNKLLFLITIVTVGAALFIFRRPLGMLLGIPIP